MPHLIVQCSRNCRTGVDLDAFCLQLKDALLASGLFETGAVRVRAFPAEHYAIADCDPQNAFVDLVLRIGAGRSEAEKTVLGDALMKVAEAAFSAEMAEPYFGLSLEIQEISAAFSWKKNTMHRRFRSSAS